MEQTACVVCESEKWKNRYRIADWNILECRCCGFSKLDPLPSLPHLRSEFYSENKVQERNTKRKHFLARTSSILKGKAKRWFRRDKNDLFSNRIVKFIPAGGSILDIGCGDGSFLERLKKTYRCSGIEISEYLGNKAKARGGMDICIGDYLCDGNSSQIKKRKDSLPKDFNAITMISLIEHLPDPKGALKFCHDHLRKNGLLLLKTVNYTCINRYVMKSHWTGFRPPDHMIYFSPKTLRRVLTHLGFSKVKITSNPLNDNMTCQAWK